MSEMQVQMVWPEARLSIRSAVALPPGYHLRTYQSGDEARFYEVMRLAGWPGWNDRKLWSWQVRIVPEGWFMAVHEASDSIVASAMALHDHTWLYASCGEVGWVAADPA